MQKLKEKQDAKIYEINIKITQTMDIQSDTYSTAGKSDAMVTQSSKHTVRRSTDRPTCCKFVIKIH